MVADLSLDREMLQDVIRRKPEACSGKRKLVDAVRGDWDVSIRRACHVFSRSTRSTYHYKSRRHDQAGIAARDQGDLRGPVCDVATVAYMSCCVGRVGR